MLDDDDLLNEVDLDDVLSDVKKEEFKGMQEHAGGKVTTKRKLTIQEEQELRGTVMVRAKNK